MTGPTDLIGLILPPFIDLVNKRITSSQVRFVISIVACLVIAVLLNLNAFNTLDWNTLLEKAALIFAQAQITYKLYWQDSKVRVNMNLKV